MSRMLHFRVVREVYTIREHSRRPGHLGLFVKVDACKVAWTGVARTADEAAEVSLRHLGCNSLKRLVGGHVIGVVARFRLEYLCPDAGMHRSNAGLPLRSGDWPILMENMHIRYFGPSGVKELFKKFEEEGLRPE